MQQQFIAVPGNFRVKVIESEKLNSRRIWLWSKPWPGLPPSPMVIPTAVGAPGAQYRILEGKAIVWVDEKKFSPTQQTALLESDKEIFERSYLSQPSGTRVIKETRSAFAVDKPIKTMTMIIIYNIIILTTSNINELDMNFLAFNCC